MDVSFVSEHGIATKRTLVAKCNEESHGPLIHLQQETTHPDKQSSRRRRSKYTRAAARILMNMSGELIGTSILTLVICSVVSAAVLSGAQVGIWQVAVVCGLGVAISIYCVSYLSGAHLNPAITLAFAVIRHRSFSWKDIFPYVVSQFLGGVVAGAVLYAFNDRAISLYENENGIERGSNASIITAMMFGEYFPNPALYDHSNPDNLEVTSLFKALAVETWTTFILAFVIFSLTDKENTAIGTKNKILAPLMIGLTVSTMISIYGPHTQVGMNPARDLGPRIVAACAGWGLVAIPGPRRGFWVYILGPLVGALLGAALNDLLISKVVALVKQKRENEDEDKE